MINNENFSTRLSIAFAELAQKFEVFVLYRSPKELWLTSFSAQASEDAASDLNQEKAIVKMLTLPANRRLISVLFKCFRKHITCSTVTIPDRIILQFNRTKREMFSFETYSNYSETYKHFQHSNACANALDYSAISIIFFTDIVRKFLLCKT